jgi:hypothetical protein
MFNSTTPPEALETGATPTQPGQRLARGVCRFLVEAGGAPITEFTPTRGLRTDVTAVMSDGEIWCVECKSSVADFQSDAKWEGYPPWCDRFFFAVDEAFPVELLPDDYGLIMADDFGAEIARQAPLCKLSAARRKAQTLRLARAAMLRLRAVADPGVAALMHPDA